jgi:hypothetical protein
MSGTRISDMTPLGSLPASGARVPLVKDGDATNYLYDLAADLAGRPALISGGIGYPTGVGGVAVQQTNKATTVTNNKICGQIVTSNASLAASTSTGFQFNNSNIAATDLVIVNIASGASALSVYQVTVDKVSAGSCHIHLRNTSASPLADALTLNFAVIKGAAS